MIGPETDVYLQPLVIRSTSESTNLPLPQEPIGDTIPAYSYTKKSSAIAAFVGDTPIAESQIVRTVFSNVPVIWQSQLAEEYRELGQVLTEMTDLSEDEEWKIDAPVYNAACYMALGLMTKSVPAPRVFTHGPKSVVFNWVHGSNNLYLTISADRVSALLTSPERIKERIEISGTANEFLTGSETISSLRAAQLNRPVVLVLTGSLLDATSPLELTQE